MKNGSGYDGSMYRTYALFAHAIILLYIFMPYKLHLMVTNAQIDQFFSCPVALAGVSRNTRKFGYQVYKTLADKKKYTLYPVNPNADEIDGQKCYRDIMSLPADAQSIVILTRKDKTEEAVRQAVQRGMKNIWIQQMGHTFDALRIAKESGANVIFGKCIMMFGEPVAGVHKFHRSIYKLFGRLPK
jgi:uncharacterized protein